MRTLLAVALLVFSTSVASACDVCGCSISGNYFGILPQFSRHFVGLRWSERSFQTAHTPASLRHGIFHSTEQFSTLDALVRFYPHRRVQLLALVPYQWIRRDEAGVITQTQGLGDVSLMANYIVFNSGDSLRRTWRHTLAFGLGVKAPTGRFQSPVSGKEAINANLQPGSGSTDLTFGVQYTLRRGSLGLASDAYYRFNTANKQGFQFGNRVNGSCKFFYWQNIHRAGLALLPNAGIYTEAAGLDRQNGEILDDTGGMVTLGLLGLDVYAAGRVSAGVTFQAPLYHDLGGGTIQPGKRWMFTLNYIF